MQNVYGIVECGIHKDVSKTSRGAKNYATRHGFNSVSIRYNCGYVTRVTHQKVNGKWVEIHYNL